jgi:hypothetical protein
MAQKTKKEYHYSSNYKHKNNVIVARCSPPVIPAASNPAAAI